MKPLHSSVLGRLLAVGALCAAFLVMASVFVPHQIEAREDTPARHPTSDPHEGLRLIGTLEHIDFIVRIYATDHGPRYSVYAIDEDRHREIGVLLSEEQIERHHPGLPIRGVEFNGRQMMHVPTNSEF
jgi:hypothetical protein